MRRGRSLGLVAGMLILLTACVGPQSAHDSGVVLMLPYASEGLGIRGMVPMGWGEGAPGEFHRGSSAVDPTTLIYLSVPGLTVDELAALAPGQLGLEAFPESTGTYRSPYLTWRLYRFEMDRAEIGVLDLSLALAEGGATSYVVLLAASSVEHQARAAFFETIFFHALHALAPIE